CHGAIDARPDRVDVPRRDSHPITVPPASRRALRSRPVATAPSRLDPWQPHASPARALGSLSRSLGSSRPHGTASSWSPVTSERPVGLLVNNAGIGTNSRFLAADVADEEEALALMVRAVLVLSHAAANAMVPRGRGAILNVSSMAPLLASGPYSAHKAWVRTFT